MTSIKKNIIYQDDHLVAINKPSGWLSVPDRFDEELPSLKRMLRAEFGEIFVIHRLDRDTSGVILFAKDAEAHRYYSGIFEERKVEKTYLGMVHGTPPQSEGTIDKPIAPHFTVKGKMMVYRKGTSAFEVGLTSDLDELDIRAQRGPLGDRWQATITVKRALLKPGPLKGTIRIETNDPEFPVLIVPVAGLVLPPPSTR